MTLLLERPRWGVLNLLRKG
jgi:6-phosphofructokinase 1